MAYNLMLSGNPAEGEYKFQMRAKQSGTETGLDLASRWVSLQPVPPRWAGLYNRTGPGSCDHQNTAHADPDGQSAGCGRGEGPGHRTDLEAFDGN